VPLNERGVLPSDTPVADAPSDGWVLVVDGDRRPLGWASADVLPSSGVLGDARLAPIGHTFDIGSDSVRAALDAAILSPSGRAVSVDAGGRLVGVADQQDLSAAIARSGRGAEPGPAADDADAPSLAKEGG
jgi:osmoprotectant transport system ATP-binding protein